LSDIFKADLVRRGGFQCLLVRHDAFFTSHDLLQR
jgi:hypothetical protein